MTQVDPWDPSNPRNRDRTRVSRRQVREILMDWDPIGVAGVAEAADEYDCMIGPLMRQLFEGATAPSLGAWIAGEQLDHFGLGPDREADDGLARNLIEWWRQRTTPSLS